MISKHKLYSIDIVSIVMILVNIADAGQFAHITNNGNNVVSVIIKPTPTITWSNPADIVYGIPLSDTQLDAIASDPKTGAPVPGTFVYNPAAGTVLSAGLDPTLNTIFTPTDTANYTTASDSVLINVTPNTTPIPTVANFTSNVTIGYSSL